MSSIINDANMILSLAIIGGVGFLAYELVNGKLLKLLEQGASEIGDDVIKGGINIPAELAGQNSSIPTSWVNAMNTDSSILLSDLRIGCFWLCYGMQKMIDVNYKYTPTEAGKNISWDMFQKKNELFSAHMQLFPRYYVFRSCQFVKDSDGSDKWYQSTFLQSSICDGQLLGFEDSKDTISYLEWRAQGIPYSYEFGILKIYQRWKMVDNKKVVDKTSKFVIRNPNLLLELQVLNGDKTDFDDNAEFNKEWFKDEFGKMFPFSHGNGNGNETPSIITPHPSKPLQMTPNKEQIEISPSFKARMINKFENSKPCCKNCKDGKPCKSKIDSDKNAFKF